MDDSRDHEVLTAHHERNRRPKPPDPKHLKAVWDSTEAQHVNNRSISPSSTIDTESNSDEPSIFVGRAKRNSKCSGGPQVTQLGFYPGNWVSVLENGKDLNRISVAIKAGFPTRAEGLKEADGCLHEAMVTFDDEGGSVKSGMDLAHISILY